MLPTDDDRKDEPMPTPQFNMRVPQELHSGLREVAEILRHDPGLLEELLAACRQVAKGRSFDAADRLPPAADSPEDLPRLDQIEQRLDRIEAWLTSGGMRRTPPGTVMPSGVRVGMLPKAVRG